MLYHLFEYLEANFQLSGAGLFQYISFRSATAIILSLTISIVFGKRIIGMLQKKQVGEEIRDLDLAGQMAKQGTPTMGGLIIILSILVPCLLLADLTNVYIQLMILSTIWMGLIGFADDYIKVFKKDKKGLRGRFKILGQVGLGLIVGIVMFFHNDVVVRMTPEKAQANGYEIVRIDTPSDMDREMAYVKTTLTNIPFFSGNQLDYSSFIAFTGDNAKKLAWIIFIPLVIFIVTAVSNAANLTDGLDGLATGTSAIIGATLGVLAYVSGNAIFSDYLKILYLPETQELVIFSACFIGACIGFLWYNAFPAQVFMGDTGSLTLGGIIAALAIVLRKELLIPILCGIFVIENLSVMIQVGYFKYTKRKYGEGRRVFLMSPLHHHYQKKNIPEPKIVARFWIVGVLLAALTIITLKIR
ncbi:MAG: phospho-N-acetylmuramoyl-pentapeptide-transferase [Bacteroidota bacterium]